MAAYSRWLRLSAVFAVYGRNLYPGDRMVTMRRNWRLTLASDTLVKRFFVSEKGKRL